MKYLLVLVLNLSPGQPVSITTQVLDSFRECDAVRTYYVIHHYAGIKAECVKL